jgi:succinate-semialdehyde dehydrogenase/glutarate-semialdehyde dehydrogenase
MATTSAVPTGVSLKDSKLFRQSVYIDSAWVTAKSGATINLDNPATGEIIGTVPKSGAAETRAAIEAAGRASSRR